MTERERGRTADSLLTADDQPEVEPLQMHRRSHRVPPFFQLCYTQTNGWKSLSYEHLKRKADCQWNRNTISFHKMITARESVRQKTTKCGEFHTSAPFCSDCPIFWLSAIEPGPWNSWPALWFRPTTRSNDATDQGPVHRLVNVIQELLRLCKGKVSIIGTCRWRTRTEWFGWNFEKFI